MSVNMWREVRWLDHTGSTNSDVAEEARRGEAEGLVVATLEQRAGRGRMDRAWVAPPGTSLAFSMLLEPRPERPHWGWLSLLAGIAVHEAVDGLAPEPGRVQLKWPNDVLIDGRKVCGILNKLVEHPDGDRAVIGIGVNVSIREDQLPVPTATSLRIAGLCEDPKQLLGSILERFQPLYEHWQEAGEVRDEYQRRCASIGTPLRIVVDERRIVEGIGHGVDEHGRLRVATASGIETFAVGDVIHARLARRT
jgi:biotin--[acetyl-coA-carboxylase] ligase